MKSATAVRGSPSWPELGPDERRVTQDLGEQTIRRADSRDWRRSHRTGGWPGNIIPVRPRSAIAVASSAGWRGHRPNQTGFFRADERERDTRRQAQQRLGRHADAVRAEVPRPRECAARQVLDAKVNSATIRHSTSPGWPANSFETNDVVNATTITAKAITIANAPPSVLARLHDRPRRCRARGGPPSAAHLLLEGRKMPGASTNTTTRGVERAVVELVQVPEREDLERVGREAGNDQAAADREGAFGTGARAAKPRPRSNRDNPAGASPRAAGWGSFVSIEANG